MEQGLEPVSTAQEASCKDLDRICFTAGHTIEAENQNLGQEFSRFPWFIKFCLLFLLSTSLTTHYVVSPGSQGLFVFYHKSSFFCLFSWVRFVRSYTLCHVKEKGRGENDFRYVTVQATSFLRLQ